MAMFKSWHKLLMWIFGAIALVTVLALVITTILGRGSDTPKSAQAGPAAPIHMSAKNAASPVAGVRNSSKLSNGMTVVKATPRLSPKLSSIKAAPESSKGDLELNEENEELPLAARKTGKDPVVQTSFRPGIRNTPNLQASMPATVRNFAGISFNSGGDGVPPDTNGEVGPNNYVQMVNSTVMVWDKSGNPLLSAPFHISNMWYSVGDRTPCALYDDGDPIVVYDQLADRWLLSQFGFGFDSNGEPTGPYYECVAISTGGDPTGSYWLYSFPMGNTNFPDYPKFGVWPDGYYMTTNTFANAQTYAGPAVTVFERSQMLVGGSTQSLTKMTDASHAPMLPSDLDGKTLPPAGAPNYVLEDGNPMLLYDFHADWSNLANSTFTQSSSLSAAAFSYLCPSNGTNECIPQKGTTQRLDSLGDRLMFRLAYRNFSDHESLVVSRSVDVGGGRAGVRWYEIRNPSGTASIYQQGTYAPADGNSRWMPSVAMDKMGNMALGYSVSSDTMYPSIRYTGRLATDPLGVMPQSEGTILNGTGYQSYPGGLSRWGDYSDMTVDPTNDCTFWYTTEVNDSNSYQWQTQIASFTFPQCADSTAPTVKAPSQSFLRYSTIPSKATTSAVPVRITWSASDPSGVSAYELQQKTDSGSFVNVSLSSATAKRITRNLTPGHVYQFRVRARDKAGNWSAYKTGVSFQVAPYQETATTADSTGTKIAYTSGWTRQAGRSSYGGYVRYATASDKTVTFTMNGRAFAWISPRNTIRGEAKVYVDGTYVKTVSLYSTTSKSRQVVYWKVWSSVGTHTVKLVLVGTSGHPRVDVDAFVVLR